MEYSKATVDYLHEVVDLVQKTILEEYRKCYPKEVVEFFCELHSEDNIKRDIREGRVGILKVDGVIVGTGCYKGDHITRVYVLPAYQRQGYGNYIMRQLENWIAMDYDAVQLDASLPARRLYEKRGYKVIKTEKYELENDVIFTYEVMKKDLY